MKKELLEKAIEGISESAVADVASIRENTAKKSRRLPKIAAVAAVIAVCGAMAVAVAAGGGLIDVKNPFGTVIGQEYVGDASGDLKVSLIGFNENGPELIVEKTDPDLKLDLNGCTFTPLGYAVKDESGKTVLGDGSDLKCAEEWYEALGCGTYTFEIDGLRAESKGDQPLEITGRWTTVFTVSLVDGKYTCTAEYLPLP